MPAQRLPGTFDDGLDLLGRAGYPVQIQTGHGHLTLTRWTETLISAWLQYGPEDRPDRADSPADAHATFVLDGDSWRQATRDDDAGPASLAGPDGARFTEDLPGGRDGRILGPGPVRDAMSASLRAALATLNAAFAPDGPGPGMR